MKSVSSDRIYLWSKRLGAMLLLAMAIVAVGNAQQSSAGKKGKLNVAEPFDFLPGSFQTLHPKPHAGATPFFPQTHRTARTRCPNAITASGWGSKQSAKTPGILGESQANFL